jgi:hypothetical protein
MTSANAENRLNVLNELHNLLVHNVIGDKQYNSRYNGFVAELDFQSWFESNREGNLIDGGMFIPTVRSDNPFDSAIFITTSDKPAEEYINIYSKACEITPNLVGLFFIKYDSAFYEKWNKSVLFSVSDNSQISQKSFSIPQFEVFKFEPTSKSFNICTIDSVLKNFTKSKEHLRRASIPPEMKDKFISKLSVFELKHLVKLYLERLFFDGYLNLTYTRGAPLDIDAFVYGKKSELCLLEIKEKDISKKKPKGFGMDLRRIDSLNKLTQVFESRTCYVVRHVSDQKKREFIDWRLIDFEDFKKNIEDSPVVTGGTGMRGTNSYNPTKVCAFEYFKKLD